VSHSPRSLTWVNQSFPRPLTQLEQSILAKLFSVEAPDREALRSQITEATVTGRCECGCASIELSVDRSLAEPASRTWRPFPVELAGRQGERPLEVILFVDDGWISYLELVWYDEPAPPEFPPAESFEVVARPP
jgi:hypothetical protein